MSPRVVSLLPFATELLCAIPGGEALLVGRSHECDVPASVGDRPTLTAARTRGVHEGGDSASAVFSASPFFVLFVANSQRNRLPN